MAKQIEEEELEEIKTLNSDIQRINKSLSQMQTQLAMKQGAYNHVMEKIIDKYDVDTDKQTLDFETGEIIEQ